MDWSAQTVELPRPFVFGAGGTSEADEATVSCLMTRGPIRASMALWAIEVPVPQAKPMHQQIKCCKIPGTHIHTHSLSLSPSLPPNS